MHDSHKEARELWKSLGNFWSKFQDADIISYMWQAIVEKGKELAFLESDIVTYSIEDIPVRKKVVWEYVNILSLDDDIMNIPLLRSAINSANAVEYVEDDDYELSDGVLTPVEVWGIENFWAPVLYKYNDLVEKYYNNGFLDLDLDYFNNDEKKHILRAVWKAIHEGPTSANILSVINILAGSPFMHYQGTVGIHAAEVAMDYNIYVYVKTVGETNVIYTGSIAEADYEVADNWFTLSGLSIGDVLEIDDEIYYIIEQSGDSNLLSGSLTDDTYAATIYRRASLSTEILTQGVLKDKETSDIYIIMAGILEGNFSSEREMVLSHRYIAERAETYELTGSYDILTEATVSQYGGVSISSGDILPGFHPIYEIFQLHTWKDVEYAETIANIDKPDLINYIYNNEIDQIYHLEATVDNNKTLTINDDDDDFDRLAAGDEISIRVLKRTVISVESLNQNDDGKWIVEIEDDTFDYSIGDNIVVYEPKALEKRHIGNLCTIISGEYVNGMYYLTVNKDLSDLTEGSSYVQRVSPINHVREIANVIGRSIVLDSNVDADLDDFVIIQKTRSGEQYGDNNVKAISTIVGDVVTLVSAYAEVEDYQYLVLKDDINPAEIYEISEIDGDDITLTENVVGTFPTANHPKAIFIKSLPYHGGFVIKQNPNHSYDVATMLLSNTSFVSNVEKVLAKLLPAGWKYYWRIS